MGEPLKFYADAMLGRLATWMRALGFDVKYDSVIEDSELIKRAASEGRVILTRDTLLIRRRGARGRHFFVRSDRVRDQLREVAGEFRPDEGLFLTRCLRCNTVLDSVSKESLKDSVPPYVYSTQESFSRCPDCGRIYWGGTHKDRMKDEFGPILKG